MTSTYILVAAEPRIEALLATAHGETTAVVVGPRALADAVAATGVDAVTWLGDPGEAPAEAFAPAVAALVAAARPDLVLASTRPADRALAGAVAAVTGAPVLTGATAVAPEDDGVTVTRTVFGGIAQETDHVAGPVVLVLESTGTPVGAPVPVTELAAAALPGLTVTQTRAAERQAADLGKATRIVAAGRGVKAQEDLALVEALAGALGAEVACSRPLSEGVGWFSHDRYVGVTGQHVSPELYLAVGISGQLQHTVGARAAGTVVAINSDANAPYFQEADYCVVGDLYALVPAITRALA